MHASKGDLAEVRKDARAVPKLGSREDDDEQEWAASSTFLLRRPSGCGFQAPRRPTFMNASEDIHAADASMASPLHATGGAPVVVVVPSYNEAERLDRDAFLGFLERVEGIDLLFVNDGSRDATLPLLHAMRDAAPSRIGVLDLKINGGKAEAVRAGLLAALRRERRPEAIGFWDADLATPLEAIPEFAAILRDRPEIEMVFGSRVNLLGRQVRRHILRHWIGRIFATLASQTLRLAIYDTQCGAKMLRATDEVASMLEKPFRSRWIFDVELLARLVRQRRGTDRPQPERVIVELPLHRWIDRKGSKLRWHDFLTVGGDLFGIWWRELRGVPKPRRWASGTEEE